MGVEDSSRTAAILDSIGGSVTKISLIVAAVVALNTTLSECSEANTKRYERFKTAVASEQTYWRDLYAAYADAKKSSMDDEESDARLLTIYALAGHPPAKFDEYTLGLIRDNQDIKDAAANHITSLRVTLRAALQREEAIAGRIADLDFAAAEQDALRLRQGRTVPPAVAQATDVAVEQSAATAAVVNASDGSPDLSAQVLAAGTATGWDVDVFWCEGDDATTNRMVASAAAETLSLKAGKAQSIAPGVVLGRIRLRQLPVARQATGDYPTDGMSVVYDAAGGELFAAEQIRLLLAGTLNYRFDRRRSGRPSKWYLSIFVCKVIPAN